MTHYVNMTASYIAPQGEGGEILNGSDNIITDRLLESRRLESL